MAGTDVIEDLQIAIEWYTSVVPAPERAPYGPPTDRRAVDAALAEVDAAIAPLVLPAEIRWMWQTWETVSFDLVHPRLCDPAFALDSWQEGVLADRTDPWALFPVAYQGHCFLLAELGTDPERPAPIWAFAFLDPTYRCAFPSLAAMFRSCAEVVEASGVRLDAANRHEDRPRLHGPAFERVVDRHFTAAVGPERREVLVDDVRAWPALWQSLRGVEQGGLEVRGRSHTTAELRAACRLGPMTARLHGRWYPWKPARNGTIGRLVDGAGEVPVVLPSDLPSVGRIDDVDLEVDVTAEGHEGELPTLDTAQIMGSTWSARQ